MPLPSASIVFPITLLCRISAGYAPRTATGSSKIRVFGHKQRLVGIGHYSIAASEGTKKGGTVSNPHQRP